MRFSGVLAAALLCFTCAAPAATAQDDVAAVPAKDVKIEGKAKQRYFLIGDTTRTAPEAGFGLLLVLPGGDGSDEFHPFVKRIYANALPDGYLVAQLVAVPSKNPNQIVWPTAKTKDAEADVHDRVVHRQRRGRRARQAEGEGRPRARVHALAGPPAAPPPTQASLAKDTPVKGSFVAMSIFPIN